MAIDYFLSAIRKPCLRLTHISELRALISFVALVTSNFCSPSQHFSSFMAHMTLESLSFDTLTA